jgi:hypothetical protein
MNEELIDKMFEDAVSQGYSKDKNSFISLLNSDMEVFNDMYIRFGQGQMNTDQFRSVITPKKKESSQVGSQKTPPTSGSKPAQSSGKSFAGSIDYLDQAPKFGEIPTAPKVPGMERVAPAQQATKKPETPKRTIVRGEEADQAIAESLAPQAPVAESTQPVSLESKYKNIEKLETEADKITGIIETGERTKNFTPKDIENNYNEYAKNALDDYLDYLNFTDQGGSQYQKTKEQLDYYRSLGDKLFNDEQYADDYNRYVDLQQDAILNVNKQDAKYVNKLKTKYDWDTFNKKTSEVELKLSNIENQIKNISSDGTPLTPLEQKKYDDLLKQYNQIQTDYTNFSSELGITQEAINQMSNSASRLAASQKAVNSIENEDNVNSRRLKEYKSQLLSNKKAKEEFYGDKDQAWYEQFGKGLLSAGEQLGSSLIKGSISMVGDLPQLLTDAIGIEGYGVTDRLAEAADNINSYVDLVVPQLEDKDFPGFVQASRLIGNGLGSVGTFMLSGGGAVKMAQGVLKTSAAKGLQTASRVGAFSAASSMSAGQMYDQLIEEGFTPAEASRYALAGGLVMGAAEMIVPEDQLLANSIRRTFIGTLKNTSNIKQASEEALKFIYNRSSDVLKNSLKEGGEEAIGQFAQDLSLQATSSISGKEVDGLWEIQPYADNFLAGGGVGGVIELLKFGTRNSKYTNRFKESTLLELADNYDDISNKMSQIKPEDFDKIGEKYAKLKNVNNALKDIPGFDDLSHADKSHVLALAYNKQVILDSVKQSGLDKSNFDEELTRIDQDIQTTLNKPKEVVQEPNVEKTQEQTEVDNLNDDEEYTFSYIGEDKIPSFLKGIAEKTKNKATVKRGLFGKTENFQFYQVKATGKQIKDLYYAVQKPSTEEVLPRQQGATTETGSEPQGMGQDVQGQEATQEGQEVSQEGVTTLNQESFSEDVTPEQKAKVEEQNQKDEDESINEIYDFNDEIKSIGTKEQFKQFLRSLAPKAAFSRIAWHNTKKPELTPREGQYYTNTRKNAEDTYKQDNTFAAIVFGNAPKKASFDEVQQVDTKAVKGEGADIVVTDDLSPAIGADMNYREFVPTSAEQVIPIGTKENVEAFKAFVEQQKAPEVQAAEEVVAEEKEPTTEEQTKMEEEAAKSEAMTPKNMKDLIGIYRKVFNLSYPKALVSAMVSNRLVNQMAKRAGVTPEQMYQKLSFQQITEQQLKGLSKNGKILKQIVGKDAKAIKGKDFDFDGEYDVVANGSKIGKIHYDRSLKSWMNSEFYRGSERAGTYKWIFGDILGDTKQEAIDELVRRYNEAEQNQSEQKYQETKPPVKKEITQEDVDDILGDIQDSGMIVQKSPIESGVYIINENVRLDLRAFDNMINLSSILSIEKGKGSASSVLREIGKSADKRGLTISLDAKAFSEGGLSTSQLLDFYSRFGFEIDPNGIFKDDSIEEIKDYLEMNPNESVGMIRTPGQEILFQNYGEKTRGAVTIAKDGRAIIYALTDANVSTPLHELAHVFEHYLTKEEKAKIIKSANTERWTRETSEYFARGFENYLATGESSNPIFEKFKQFLLDIYKAIKGSPIDVKLNKQMKDIYAQMVGEDLTEDLGEGIDTNLDKSIIDAVETLANAEEAGGSEITKAQKEVAEKLGEEGKKLVEINRNFDKLAEDLGFIKTCIIE